MLLRDRTEFSPLQVALILTMVLRRERLFTSRKFHEDYNNNINFK